MMFERSFVLSIFKVFVIVLMVMIMIVSINNLYEKPVEEDPHDKCKSSSFTFFTVVEEFEQKTCFGEFLTYSFFALFLGAYVNEKKLIKLGIL
jgi:hypothetical protein